MIRPAIRLNRHASLCVQACWIVIGYIIILCEACFYLNTRTWLTFYLMCAISNMAWSNPFGLEDLSEIWPHAALYLSKVLKANWNRRKRKRIYWANATPTFALLLYLMVPLSVDYNCSIIFDTPILQWKAWASSSNRGQWKKSWVCIGRWNLKIICGASTKDCNARAMVLKRELDGQENVWPFIHFLTAKGCFQKYCVNYSDTNAADALFEIFFLFERSFVSEGWHAHQVDITSAFRNGDKDIDLCVIWDKLFYKLEKSVYSSMQYTRLW